MSSGFVSGGTTDNPIQRDDEWLKAQQEIEGNRRRREEEGRQEGGKSLYEVLQNNKAAKQEAFEESTRLKNQFRNLDEDEVEFLDSVLESTRAKEAAVKKETSQQLDQFRRQQEEADKVLLDGATAEDPKPTSEESQWVVNARKRKRAKERDSVQGLKIRKSSTNEAISAAGSSYQNNPLPRAAQESRTAKSLASEPTLETDTVTRSSKEIGSLLYAKSPPPLKSSTSALDLAAYSSDED